jgi:hypothetical protein
MHGGGEVSFLRCSEEETGDGRRLFVVVDLWNLVSCLLFSLFGPRKAFMLARCGRAVEP